MKKNLKYIVLLFALIAIDQLTKLLVVRNLADGTQIVIWEGVLKLLYHQNDGAIWGIFSGATVLISAFGLLILAVVLWAFTRIPRQRFYEPLRILLTLISAGAIGNLIDRIRLGYVIDFVYFELINFPIFNLADTYISVSAVLAVLFILFKYRNDEFTFFSLKKKAHKKPED